MDARFSLVPAPPVMEIPRASMVCWPLRAKIIAQAEITPHASAGGRSGGGLVEPGAVPPVRLSVPFALVIDCAPLAASMIAPAPFTLPPVTEILSACSACEDAPAK